MFVLQDMQPHYIYSPREMSRWVRGICEALRHLETLAVEGLVRIWAHEALRLFQVICNPCHFLFTITGVTNTWLSIPYYATLLLILYLCLQYFITDVAHHFTQDLHKKL